MKHIFVVNGREDKAPVIKEYLQKELPALDIQFEMYETKGVGDGIRFVRIYCDLHREEEDFFIACGGSGTLNEVVSGVVGFKDKKIGFLAFGQTNDFIKCYPGYDFTSLKKLLNGSVAKVDIVRANNWYSLNMINIGFDCYVSYEGNKYMDRGMGFKKAYALALVKCILARTRNAIRVTADGERLNKRTMLLCSVSNGQWCGGMFHCAPKAVVDDGLMDVCLVKPCSLISILLILGHFIKGDQLESRFCLRHLIYKRVKHLEVKSDDIIFISPDGEVCADLDFTIEVLPGEISFVLPENSNLG